ncbi:MAG: molybdopterin molybdotransferase MoeA [Geminicoccaceae bacterium]|nr:molybdopterin molybdotransferase MoeA [Geminicoccaceae bacterium]
MLPLEEARARVLAAARPVGREWLALPDALDRVLDDDLRARHDQPPVAVSAMDGYAVRAADTDPPGRWLRLVGESRAGGPEGPSVEPGTAVRIFTGAPLPAGADAIAIQENAEVDGERVRFVRSSRPGEFVRPAGLDFSRGSLGLSAGTVLDPSALALAAAMGHAWIPVRRKPRVAILATGDELLWPGEPVVPGRVAASNSIGLAALVRRLGGVPLDLGIAPDSPECLVAAFGRLGAVDLIVTSGGASVGSYDLVRSALGREGLLVDFWTVAMRPGKPLIFGRFRDVPLLGVPGNPVSALVCGLVFVRAVLLAMLGLPSELPVEPLPVRRDLPANDQRADHLRARIVEAEGQRAVEPAERQDSSMLATLARADALILRPPHAPPVPAGTLVPCVPLERALRLGGPRHAAPLLP